MYSFNGEIAEDLKGVMKLLSYALHFYLKNIHCLDKNKEAQQHKADGLQTPPKAVLRKSSAYSLIVICDINVYNI